MSTGSVPPSPANHASTPPDFEAIKKRQQATWATGDFAVIGTTLQIVGESLCEAVDLRSGERVLDVACGNGNAALAAARRFADVSGIDFVPALVASARKRAEAEGATLDLHVGDAEHLPFHDSEFDVVLSTYGCMFTPDQERTARELMRVCRSGGRIGLANWTPGGFIGQLFRVIGKHVAPPAGVRSPALWGTEARLAELFGSGASRVDVVRKDYLFRYASTEHWIDVFRRYYGPVSKAFDALAPAQQRALAEDIRVLLELFHCGGETLVVRSEYLEVVVHRA